MKTSLLDKKQKEQSLIQKHEKQLVEELWHHHATNQRKYPHL